MWETFWEYCKTTGGNILLTLIRLDNAKQLISGIVMMLLMVGAVIVAGKFLALLLNRIALYRIRRRVDRWWQQQDITTDPISFHNRYHDFSAVLLGQKTRASHGKLLQRPSWKTLLSGRLVLQYIYGLYTIRRANGTYERESLRDIVQEKLDRWLDLPRYLAGSFVLLGLFGTVMGLSRSMEKIVPMIRAKEVTDLSSLQSIIKVLLGTIESMEIAMHTTLIGLVGTLILSLVLVFYRQFQSKFLIRLEEFIQVEVIPGLFPQEASMLRLPLENMEKQSRSILVSMSEIKTQIATTAQQFNTIPPKLIDIESELRQINSVFDERFDQQFNDLRQLTDDLSRAMEQVDRGGGRLQAFVLEFEQSIQQQVHVTEGIQEAQQDFNKIIENYKDVMSQIRGDSSQVLELVKNQQGQLSKLLQDHENTVQQVKEQQNTFITLYKEEREYLSQARKDLQGQQQNWLAGLDRQLRQELESLHQKASKNQQDLQESLNILFTMLKEQTKALQESLDIRISSAATTIGEHIVKTYEQAGASIRSLQERSEQLVNTSEEWLKKIAMQIKTHREHQQRLEQIYGDHTQTIEKWSASTQQTWHDGMNKLQIALEVQLQEWQKNTAQVVGIGENVSQLTSTVARELPITIQEHATFLQQLKNLQRELAVILQHLSGLEQIPKHLLQHEQQQAILSAFLQQLNQGVESLRITIQSMHRDGITPKDLEQLKRLVDSNLSSVQSIEHHLKDHVERKRGIMGWFR